MCDDVCMGDKAVPTGTVTFLFTDVEGSTRLWAADDAAMSASLRVHDEILRAEIESRDGYVFTTAGDSFAAAFGRASDAVAAAAASQAALAQLTWPGPELKVRIGLHLGEAEERGGDYFGPVVNTTARVEAAGHGGQILVTDVVRSAAGVDGIDLGEHALRDLAQPIRLWQLGDGEFPLLRTGAVRSNLPSPPTRLVDRENDISQVRRLLRTNRLVTLSAVGGTGKTRLAIAVADEELPDWSAGVWFVDLTAINEDADFCAFVAKVVGLELGGGDPVQELVDFIAPQSMLVVLDNCEHVVDVCAEFAERMVARPGKAAILATSREWLDIDGERTYLVGSLATDGAEAGAVRLFADRATAVDQEFVLDESNVEHVIEVCRRLDGIPLALELAASRSAVLSPAELAAGLDDRFQLLSGGRRRQRQRTLEATIDWSYDLLESDEREAFSALGVFVGSFDLDAVAAVCGLSRGRAVDIVESLLAKSLVVRVTEGRFQLLETLKAYAEDRLVDNGTATVARDRHLEHFIERAGAPDPLSTDAIPEQALLVDTGNLLAAADWAETRHRWADIGGLLPAVCRVLRFRGDHAGAIERIERSASQIEDPDVRGSLDWMRGLSFVMLADWAAYVALCRAHMASDDPYRAAIANFGLSTILSRHDPDESLKLIERGASLQAQSKLDDFGGIEALKRSDLLVQLGRFQEAREWALSFLEASGKLQERSWWQITAFGNLSACAWAEGDFDALRELVDEAAGSPLSDPRLVSGYEFSAALLTLGADGSDARADVLRRYALTATTDRAALEQNDALVLLVVLAMAEGDEETAARLVLQAGSPRSPASAAVAQECARRLGVFEELEAEYRANIRNREWLVEAPKRALKVELERRGWSEPDS